MLLAGNVLFFVFLFVLFLLLTLLCFLILLRNHTVWEIYSSNLEPVEWFISIQGVPINYAVITVVEAQTEVIFEK
jgi:hypothetical protein